MDLKKTGLFISDVRKQKGMTQKDLAEKIGVTDKAVSRWETGKGFPDVSLLVALSEALELSISDIVMGEKIEINEEKAVETMDKILINTLEYSQRIKNKILKNIFWVGNALPVLLGIIIFAVINQDNLYILIGYNAVIVPVYLLTFNFTLNYNAFYAKKLLFILSIELICILIQIAYFDFNMSPIYLVFWSIVIGIALIITTIGGIILYSISNKWRCVAIKSENNHATNKEHIAMKTPYIVIYCITSIITTVSIVFISHWIFWAIVNGYCKLAGVDQDLFFIPTIVFYLLLAVFAMILFVFEIVAVIQIYKNGETTIPLIGKIAKKMLKR